MTQEEIKNKAKQFGIYTSELKLHEIYCALIDQYQTMTIQSINEIEVELSQLCDGEIQNLAKENGIDLTGKKIFEIYGLLQDQ